MQARLIELADPAFGDFVDGDGVDEVKAFPSLALPRNQVGVVQDSEMFRHGLAGHVEALAEIAQRLAVPVAQPVEKLAAAGVCQRFEDGVIIHEIGNQKVT